MKTKFKKGICVMATAAVVPILTMYAIPKSVAVAEESEDLGVATWSVEDCYLFMEEMPNCLEDFVSEYNAIIGNGEMLRAENIEYSNLVYIEEIENYGVYFDFDENNGYVVITPENTIYAVSVNDDLDYLRDGRELYFSSIDGFLYKDYSGALQRYEVEQSNSLNIVYNDGSSTYPGQEKAGDERIYIENFNAYISERYPQYNLVREGGRTNCSIKWTKQIETSYYRKCYPDSNGNFNKIVNYEGNCSLNAMYNILVDWSSRNFIKNVPVKTTENIIEKIKNDSLYNDYGVGRIYPDIWSEKPLQQCAWYVSDITFLSSMPVVYSKIRDYAMGKGYTVNGYNIKDVPSTMEYVANNVYGNDIEVRYTTSVTEVMKYISQDKACYLSMNGSNTYGDHGVAAIGYYLYERKIPFGKLSISVTACFFEIADGWAEKSRMLDINFNEDMTLKYCYLARC